MSSATLRASPPLWRGGYEPYGVRCNAVAASELFRWYERCGFLYPAKRETLAPYMRHVQASWDASTGSGGSVRVHHCLTAEDNERNAWGSVSMWRSSPGRVQSQHLVSTGWPAVSRRLLLGGQDLLFTAGVEITENWFRVENKYPNRIFGSVPERLGPARSAIERRALFALDGAAEPRCHQSVQIRRAGDGEGELAAGTLSRIAGAVVGAAEELDSGDIELSAVDALYGAVGLSRTRVVHLAWLAGHGGPVGIACAYRGPLGLNFSFLENRCDVWIDRGLESLERQRVCAGLLAASRPVYEDCPLPFILVACDELTLGALERWLPGRHVRTYSRCIWTREGFWDWYVHVDSFYARVMELEERRRRRRTGKGGCG